MKLYQCGVLGFSLLLPMAAQADFQYQETTQITGGSMLGLMKMAGKFSRQARDAGAPIVSTVYVQGNRMARVNAQQIEIIDLDKQTITTADLQKRTYTEMTFEQMRQQMEQAVQQAKEKQAQHKTGAAPSQQIPSNMNVQFKVDVRNTGATKQVSGVSTNESILTMQMVGTNTTNGQQGAFAMTNDMWLAPDIPGYQELQEFNKKLAAKMGDIYKGSGMSSSLAAMQPAQAQGMADMAKEVSKLKGIPVEQVMRMGSTANGQPLPAASEAPLPPNSAASQMPSAKDVAQQSAESAIASKLGGFGFGGFGRKKKQSPPDNSANPPSDQGTQTSAPGQAANVMMESTTDLTSFSSAPIDSAKFSVPAGFTQVQPPQPAR